MNKINVRIVLATLFLLTCGVANLAGSTVPRPPICPPDAICTPFR
jgi:hypothetical protein